VDAAATLTVGGQARSVADLLDALDPADRDGVRRTDLVLVT
jgi:2-amino-4-hydroxy-6-hydroxymethyldihydropteridine diphosphokinase